MGELHIFDFRGMIADAKCKAYVETGTGVGVCLRHMLQYPFEELHTIDLDPKMIMMAKDHFKDERIRFYNQLSTEALLSIVPKLDPKKPTFFFLDAHFPDADFNGKNYADSIQKHGKNALPLWDELQIITKHRNTSKDIIIIDDWKIYEPSIQCQYPGWEHGEKQKEVGIMTDGEKIKELFADTHSMYVNLNHQGFLFISPTKHD